MDPIRVKMRGACYLPDSDVLKNFELLTPTKSERVRIVTQATSNYQNDEQTITI